MTQNSALLFRFADDASAALAAETLRELGYDPSFHGSQELHIHLEGSDLTTALEIAQSHGGSLANQALIEDGVMNGTTYSLDAIPIPAHMVNEDLVAQETDSDALRNRDDDASDSSGYLLDGGAYNHFSGDVKA
ncbi:hypothetical protein [Paenibacillus spongiae]|uniref:Uncharacterized protein n=1 Tax=Paenibacillus spongiae TaxID=2909671 RepID=A0ABY5S5J8_9BACL|nr:hypothetical protein [Paenibacillus spongiae]UVI28850.1 hypothetical protein L1F29_25925 [Paenibacillus spongiae]